MAENVQMEALRYELQQARQALWDVYRELGFDTDGDATPAAVVDLNDLVVNAAKEFRQDYEQAIGE